MANWGRSEALDKVKAENGREYNFTLHRMGQDDDIEKGYILVKDTDFKWHKISGFKSIKTKKFVADRRAKWAHLVTPGMSPIEDSFPLTEPLPKAEDYKVEKLGPPIGFASSKPKTEETIEEMLTRIDASLPPEFNTD